MRHFKLKGENGFCGVGTVCWLAKSKNEIWYNSTS